MSGTLALDLATTTGWAYAPPGATEPSVGSSGVWRLAKSGEGWGRRFVRLRDLLEDLAPGRVVYELVERHESPLPKPQRGRRPNFGAAHVYGGLLATVLEYCERRGLPYEGYGVAAIKRQATGKGGGKGTAKADMLAAARARYGPAIEDDNQADAIFLLELELRERAAFRKGGRS